MTHDAVPGQASEDNMSNVFVDLGAASPFEMDEFGLPKLMQQGSDTWAFGIAEADAPPKVCLFVCV